MNIGFIGAGNLATSLLSGMAKTYEKKEIYIYEKVDQKAKEFEAQGYSIVANEQAVLAHCSIVFLMVKPAQLKEVLLKIGPVASPDTIFVSPVAGVSVGFIRTVLKNPTAKVVRTMPNTSSLIGKGATAVSYDRCVHPSEVQTVLDIFNGIGMVAVLPETQMNEVISVNASSPAYVYLFIKALIDGAVEQGLEESVAQSLVLASMLGCISMAKQSSDTIETLIQKVCSPNGTTERAVASLKQDDFEKIIKKAMYACTDRARALEAEIAAD